MVRPKQKRYVCKPPVMEGFKPFGIPMTQLEPLVLLYEEYESIRLADYEGMNQVDAAEKMNVSRPTFTRIYESARRTIAKAFVEGTAIFIEGGNYQTDDFWYRCNTCMKVSVSPESIKKCEYCNSEELRILNAEKGGQYGM